MKRYIVIFIVLALSAVGSLTASEHNRELYQSAKSSVEQWVKTENLISKEMNDWKKSEAILSNTRDLLKTEKEELEAKLEELKSGQTIADEKRIALLEEKEALEKSRAILQDSIVDLESKLKSVLPYLPENFKESADKAIRSIPQDSENSKVPMSIRVGGIVAVLSQASKFDNTISKETEVREMSDGSMKEVTTVYLGFSLAYFADPTGEYAGMGVPSENGWQWTETNEYSAAILDAIAMYEKNEQAAFVTLPVAIN